MSGGRCGTTPTGRPPSPHAPDVRLNLRRECIRHGGHNDARRHDPAVGHERPVATPVDEPVTHPGCHVSRVKFSMSRSSLLVIVVRLPEFGLFAAIVGGRNLAKVGHGRGRLTLEDVRLLGHCEPD